MEGIARINYGNFQKAPLDEPMPRWKKITLIAVGVILGLGALLLNILGWCCYFPIRSVRLGDGKLGAKIAIQWQFIVMLISGKISAAGSAIALNYAYRR